MTINREKYLSLYNGGANDDNKYGFNVGDVVHTSGKTIANRYGYCGYEEMDIPRGARVRLLSVKETTLNASTNINGRGDVYVDFEFLDHKNPDGTPVRCGNRHGFSIMEAHPDFLLAPNGTGWPGYRRNGMWCGLDYTLGEPDRFGRREIIYTNTLPLI